ncbi:MAG TPA: hypothetical protein VE263_14495 [Candidatus Angelobacter sp.]|nr:hypothetical protein [Candidatus Angelobacter sp.]
MFAPPARGSELKPATSAAFDRYIAATEAQRESDAGLAQFLIIDALPDAQRQAAYDQLQQGQVYIQELRTREEGQSIPIPSGLIHHWAGVIFIPKATLPEILAVLNDYDHQADIYKPDVRQSKLLGQTGDDAEIFEQFYSKTIVTVVLNAYFHVAQRPLSASRCESASRSTRIVEVMNPDSPGESEGAYGKDHGYMWRLNSYWRIEEKDGGVYVQNESVSLSRTMPVLLAWLIEPLTKSIPRDVLSRTLEDTRRAVEANAAKANTRSRKQEPRPADATP